jgi:hypothetical protein
LPSEYEKSFKDEIWGCFKYVGIPMDVLMNMPIADRRYYIMMHNRQTENSGGNTEGLETNGESDKLQMLSNVKDWH